MAETDPCEFVLPEDATDEQDPEDEDTSGGIGLEVPGAGVTNSASVLGAMQSELEPDIDGLREDMIPVNPAEIIEKFMTEEMRLAGQALAYERVQETRRAQGGEDPNLDQATFNPVFDGSQTASRSTWLFNNSSILDLGSAPQADKFDSKPAHLLHSAVAPYRSYRAPCGVPFGKYEYDPIRFTGDRMWFNAAHLDGPSEFSNIRMAKRKHHSLLASQTDEHIPDVYYINKANNGTHGWAHLHGGSGKSLYIREIMPDQKSRLSMSHWINYNKIRTRLLEMNVLGLRVRHETHELVGTMGNAARNNQEWKWSHFFYGHIPRNLVEVVLEKANIVSPNELSDSENMDFLRRAYDEQYEDANWREVYRLHGDEMDLASLNPFPFVPYYSDEYFDFTKITNPETMPRPPLAGPIVYEDYVTNIPDLLTKEEAAVLDIGNKSSFDIRPVYSYFDCLYESVFSKVLTETELPSCYLKMPDLGLITSSRRSEGISTPLIEDFEEAQRIRLLAVDNYFNLDYFNNYDPRSGTLTSVSTAEQRAFEEALSANVGDYDAYRSLAEHMEETYGFNLNNEEADIYLSMYPPEVLDELYERRYMNPMFVEFELDSIQKSPLAEAMTFNGDSKILQNMFASLREELLFEGEGVVEGNPDITVLGQVGRRGGLTYVDQILQSGITSAQDSFETSVSFSDNFALNRSKMLDFNDWFDKTFKFRLVNLVR